MDTLRDWHIRQEILSLGIFYTQAYAEGLAAVRARDAQALNASVTTMSVVARNILEIAQAQGAREH